MQCERRRRCKPIVIQCWLVTRDEKMEASCSTLRSSLWCNELLTNVRYADDLMLYARRQEVTLILHDLATMVECLVEELAPVGLSLNVSKTKNCDD